MPKNSQQDQKQARQKNSKGAQAQGTQCRDRDQRQSSDPRCEKPAAAHRQPPVSAFSASWYPFPPGPACAPFGQLPLPFPGKRVRSRLSPLSVPGIG